MGGNLTKKKREDDSSSPVRARRSESDLISLGLASIFTYAELKQATKSFHSSRELGGGGYGRVYLGNLADGRKVAVKILYHGNSKRLEQFFNEVMVLSRLRHPNLITLYGCTNPHSGELLLVYEYMPNGTVADHLHGKGVAKSAVLTWDMRMRIAIETAEALAYLHGLQPPIIHHDVKTSNILLDGNFTVKVADMGLCRQVPWDASHVSNEPESTVGYRDPEYNLKRKLTKKSDVYSFGVVLVELISGKEAVDVNRDEGEIYLFEMALKLMENLELQKLVDPAIGYDSNPEIKRMVTSVAELAWRCLCPEGKMRPPMLEVLSALKSIKHDESQDREMAYSLQLKTSSLQTRSQHQESNDPLVSMASSARILKQDQELIKPVELQIPSTDDQMKYVSDSSSTDDEVDDGVDGNSSDRDFLDPRQELSDGGRELQEPVYAGSPYTLPNFVWNFERLDEYLYFSMFPTAEEWKSFH